MLHTDYDFALSKKLLASPEVDRGISPERVEKPQSQGPSLQELQ